VSQELISQLKKIRETNGRINADQSWVVQNKARMLTQIKNTVPEEPVKFNLHMVWQAMEVLLPGRVVYSVVRPMAVFILVGGIALSGWITSASATENCLPGEMCYGVKMAVEKTQEVIVNVTGSNDAKTQMHLEFASRRANEVKQVIAKNDSNSSAQATETIKMLEESLQSVRDNFSKLGVDKPERAKEITKEITKKTEEIKTKLEDVKVLIADNMNKVLAEAQVVNKEITTNTLPVLESASAEATADKKVLEDKKATTTPIVISTTTVIVSEEKPGLTIDEVLAKLNEATASSVQTEQKISDSDKSVKEAVASNLASTTPSVAVPIINTTSTTSSL